MTDSRTGIDWATTAAFDTPISMGEIEREVQSRPLVEQPTRRALPPWLVWTILALPAFAPAIGAVILFANPWAWGGEPAWSAGFSLDAFSFGFLLGGVFAAGAAGVWLFDGRQRSWPVITVLSVTAIVSTITEILLRVPAYAGPPPGTVTAPLLLAVGSVVVLVLVLAASKPRAEESPLERDLDSLDRDGRRLLYNRTEVLRILVQRGVVPRDMMSRAILAPLGGWSELD